MTTQYFQTLPIVLEVRQNNGVGCHALLQGIFPTQGLNPRLISCIAGMDFTTGATWETQIPVKMGLIMAPASHNYAD